VSWEGGNPFPYHLKVKWGTFAKYWGSPWLILFFMRYWAKSGGGGASFKRKMNVGCGLGEGGFSKLENVFPT
jgi:hypothetical protein